MKKGYICEACDIPCYLTVVFDDNDHTIHPDYCPFGDGADWKRYKSGEDDE